MLSKKQLYQKSARELERRRLRRKHLAQEHREYAVSICPEIAELQKKLEQTSISLAKTILRGDENVSDAVTRIQKNNQHIQEQIARLLVQNGLSEDYLTPPPICPKCDDYGVIDGNPCTCLRQIRHQIAVDDIQAQSHLQLTRFEDFRLDHYSTEVDPKLGLSPYAQMSKVFDACVHYAKTFSKTEPGLLMMGKTGLGKTHLSLAIASEVMQKGALVLYDTASELVRKMTDRYFGRDRENEDFLEILCGADLLIIDDLGAEWDAGGSISAIYEIINSRKWATIVNTNLSALELQKRYGDRIVSRLFSQMTPLQFMGSDLRVRAGKSASYLLKH